MSRSSGWGECENFHHRKTSTLIPATTRRPVYTLVCEEPENGLPLPCRPHLAVVSPRSPRLGLGCY